MTRAQRIAIARWRRGENTQGRGIVYRVGLLDCMQSEVLQPMPEYAYTDWSLGA